MQERNGRAKEERQEEGQRKGQGEEEGEDRCSLRPWLGGHEDETQRDLTDE